MAAAGSTFLKLACVALVVCMVVTAPLAEAAVTCLQVHSVLGPCVAYARGRGVGPVPQACCQGIRSLNSAAKTTSDRRAACRCMKAAAGRVRGLNMGVVSGLPGKCRVRIPYKISPSTNCNSVK